MENEKGMPVLKISLKEHNENKKLKQLKASAKQSRPKSLMPNKKRLKDEGVSIFKVNNPTELNKKVSGHFGKQREEIDISDYEAQDYAGKGKAGENLISNTYDPPQAQIQTTEENSFSKYLENSSQVLIGSTVEDKLRKTKDLIDDAIHTVENANQQARQQNSQIIYEKNISPIAENELYQEPRNIQLSDSDHDVGPIQDITPAHYPKKRVKGKNSKSNFRKAYVPPLLKFQEPREIEKSNKINKISKIKKKERVNTSPQRKIVSSRTKEPHRGIG